LSNRFFWLISFHWMWMLFLSSFINFCNIPTTFHEVWWKKSIFFKYPFFYFHGNSQLRQSLSYPYRIRFFWHISFH
jgi:hypothetical protein